MKSFDDMTLPLPLQKALKSMNFNTPTPIQASTIPLGIEGKDVIACAETGSGKTGAYAIPAVLKLIEDKDKHALILAPTRELAQQIADFCRLLIKYTDGLSVTALIGGADMFKQLRSLKKNPRILVATPGRLTDHLRRKSLKLTKTEILILDEGDRMLDMGFAPQLDEILKFLPKQRQTSLFTATLPPKVKKLAEEYLTKPEQINVGRVSLPVKAINQSVAEVSSKEKENKLVDELNKRENSVIIFAKTKVRVDKLARFLDSYGFDVDLIHGDRTQGQRNRAIANFKSGKSRILCATDVAARGIDIPQVAHVINFDLPMMIEDYVHRIGRTARNGASGEALSFVTPEDYRTWTLIAKKYQIPNVELKNKPVRGGGRGSQEARGRSGGRRGKNTESRFGSRFESKSEPRNIDPDLKEFADREERRSQKPKRKSSFKKLSSQKRTENESSQKSFRKNGSNEGSFKKSSSKDGSSKKFGASKSGPSRNKKKSFGSKFKGKKSGGFKKKR